MITSEFPAEQKGLSVGGVGYYTFNLCNFLTKRGHKTTVLTRARGLYRESCLTHMNGADVYQISFLPMYPFHIAFHKIFVSRIFKTRESDFDLVNLQVPFPPLVKTSLPVVATVHSLTRTRAERHLHSGFARQLGDMIFSVIYSPLESEILHNADLITSVSTRVAKAIEYFYGLNTKVISNGVDTDFFVPNKSYHNDTYVLWVGRLIYAKGVFDLVKCAEYVCREHPSVSFFVAGDGPLMNKLRGLLKSYGLERRVVLLGQLDRATLLRYYQNCAVFVLTSHVESFPNTVLEAMSCGVPVVATNVGDVSKVVKDGETGFLVHPKDSKAMARRIIDLLDDKNLRRRIGEAARRLVENEYSWNIISNKILDCYKLII